ncbi:hypothetical protein [Sphingomonas aracearum]|uniref:Uncharacterized protein n=1 Tax=Sphingomonas aracearum TaxID=2283317 RepID=A0A369VZH0_9SPHN|nr:hypothetical protein [Sphingomonas aracearum]RDE05221.1 hypothetical protein DVW87_08075 [Sphingomonas aracearum]
MSRFHSATSTTLDELQLLSDLHAALDAADTLGLSLVGMRLEQAIAAIGEDQRSPSPSDEAT